MQKKPNQWVGIAILFFFVSIGIAVSWHYSNKARENTKAYAYAICSSNNKEAECKEYTERNDLYYICGERGCDIYEK